MGQLFVLNTFGSPTMVYELAARMILDNAKPSANRAEGGLKIHLSVYGHAHC